VLPINFHKTFIPERRLIGSLLHYAALGKRGTYQEIGAETGIPMGKSTGKVPAIIDYARGMGLIEMGCRRDSIKEPQLTTLGRVVYAQDVYLSQPLTQWIAHMNMCRQTTGAMVWRSTFAEGRRVLGSSFGKRQLEHYLEGRYGRGRDRTGPLLSCYVSPAALANASVLSCSGDLVERHKAPLLDSYAYAYSALLLALVEESFRGEGQVSLVELADKTLCFDVCLWSEGDVEHACALLERKGLLTVDRLMRPWLLEPRAKADSAWAHIYDDFA